MSFPEGLARLREQPALRALAAALPPGIEGWLVGGAVRDALRGRTAYDLDVTVTAGADELARQVADRLGAFFYLLDEERGSGRVVVLEGARRTVMDVTNLRASTLDQDLRERDFTVNAVALPLSGPARPVDPTGGMGDLAAGRLRTAAAENLARDPARALRAVRLARQLDLEIEPATRAAVAAVASRLGEVAAERLREELVKILLAADAAPALRDAGELGLLGALLPEVDALRAEPASWERALRVVAALAGLAEALATCGELPPPSPSAPSVPTESRESSDRPAAAAHDGSSDSAPADLAAVERSPRTDSHRQTTLREIVREGYGEHCAAVEARLELELAVGHPARALLVLAGLLSELPPAGVGRELPAADHRDATVAARLRALRFARPEIDTVRQLLLGEAAALRAPAPLSARELHRYFRGAGGVAIELTLLVAARAAAVDAPRETLATVRARTGEIVEALANRQDELVAPVPLLRGDDVLALGVAPGPRVGAALVALVEAQAAGEVRTRDQALELVRRLLAG